MPGSIIGVKVEPGQQVKKGNLLQYLPSLLLALSWPPSIYLSHCDSHPIAGDPLLVLSAMKMETVVAAPATGKIKRIVAKQGDSMSAGDLLIELE